MSITFFELRKYGSLGRQLYDLYSRLRALSHSLTNQVLDLADLLKGLLVRSVYTSQFFPSISRSVTVYGPMAYPELTLPKYDPGVGKVILYRKKTPNGYWIDIVFRDLGFDIAKLSSSLSIPFLGNFLRYLPYLAATSISFTTRDENIDGLLNMLRELYAHVTPIQGIRNLAKRTYKLYERAMLKKDSVLLKRAFEKNIELYRRLEDSFRRFREALTVIL